MGNGFVKSKRHKIGLALAGDEQDARALVDRVVPGRVTAQIPAVFRLGNEDTVELAPLEVAPDPFKNSLPRHGLNA